MSKDKKEKKEKDQKKDAPKALKKVIEDLQSQIDILEERIDYLESELEYEQNDRSIQVVATQEAVARVLHLLSNTESRELISRRIDALLADDYDYEADREAIYAEYFGDDEAVEMDVDDIAEMEDRVFAVDHDESLDQIEFYILDGALNGVPAEDEDDEEGAPADADEPDEEDPAPSADAGVFKVPVTQDEE